MGNEKPTVPCDSAMGRANVGRMFYLAVFVTAGFIMYQHHTRQHYEIMLAQTSRDQYEKYYKDLIAQESEWKRLYLLEQLHSASLQHQLEELRSRCRVGEGNSSPVFHKRRRQLNGTDR